MLSVVSVALEHLLRSSTRVAVAGLAVAVVLMVPLRGWRIGRLAITALHEAGHALVVLLVGGRVRAVHLRADSSGLTWHDGVGARGPRMLIAAAGYPAPGLAAVAGAGLVAGGHPEWWLGGLAALGTLALLLWVRNVFGVFVTLLGVGGLCCCMAFGPRGAVNLAAATSAWFLALGGLRASAETRREQGFSDARELARATRIPAGCFRFGFVAIAALSLAACAAVLFHLPK